jgi:RNA polymerase sigma-70 factor (ECF subfamily)
MTTTPASLLEQLRRPGDQAAWERFVRLYTPLLHFWAQRKLGLLDADAADLIQDVFVVLVQQLPQFHYDPRKRFRAWLWTILVNKARERRRRVTPDQLGDRDLAELAVPDPADELAEREYRDLLVRRALELIQTEFRTTTWQAFWECVMARKATAEVAAQLGLSADAVYKAKTRVLRRLRQHLGGLLD